MNNPFFSIVIPVYNVELYLEKCIDSVLKQSFKDFEIILIDDGSTDNSPALCDNIYNSYKNFVIVEHQKNQGQLPSRKKGVELSHGEYIVFLDSDDMIRNDMLEKLHSIIVENSPEIIIFDWQRIFHDEQLINDEEHHLFPKGFVEKEQIFKKLCSSADLNSFCKKVCKRFLFFESPSIDHRLYANLKNGEDLLQSIPILATANTFYYLPEKFYLYRMNSNSITHTFNTNTYKALYTVRPFLYDYLKKLNFDSDENKQLFFREYLNYLFLLLYNAKRYHGKDMFSIYKEFLSYDFVKKSRNYLNTCGLKNFKRIILNFFFNKHWRLLTFSLSLYSCFKNIKKILKH